MSKFQNLEHWVMSTDFAAKLARFEEGGGSHSDLLLPVSVPRSNATRSRGGRCFPIWLVFTACMCAVILLAVLCASPPWLPEVLGGRDEPSWKDSSLSEFRGSETPLRLPPPPPLELRAVHGAPFTTIALLFTLLVGCKLMCSAPDEDESDTPRKASVPTAARSIGTPPPAQPQQPQQQPPPPPPPQSQPLPPPPQVGATPSAVAAAGPAATSKATVAAATLADAHAPVAATAPAPTPTAVTEPVPSLATLPRPEGQGAEATRPTQPDTKLPVAEAEDRGERHPNLARLLASVEDGDAQRAEEAEVEAGVEVKANAGPGAVADRGREGGKAGGGTLGGGTKARGGEAEPRQPSQPRQSPKQAARGEAARGGAARKGAAERRPEVRPAAAREQGPACMEEGRAAAAAAVAAAEGTKPKPKLAKPPPSPLPPPLPPSPLPPPPLPPAQLRPAAAARTAPSERSTPLPRRSSSSSSSTGGRPAIVVLRG